MNRLFCCNRHRAVLLVLAFVLAQAYVLYASTFHIFHDSMPMCVACVAIKSYEHSGVNTTYAIYRKLVHELVEQSVLPETQQLTRQYYQSRAPPSVPS